MVDRSLVVLCFKQQTAYEMRISDWSSDVCSSDPIGVDDVDLRGRTFAALPVAGGSEFADPPNVGAEEGTPLKHQLEAVIGGGVVAAGYLYAAVHLLR